MTPTDKNGAPPPVPGAPALDVAIEPLSSWESRYLEAMGVAATDLLKIRRWSINPVQVGVQQVNPDGSMTVVAAFVIPPGMFKFQGRRVIVAANGQPILDVAKSWLALGHQPPGVPRLGLLVWDDGLTDEVKAQDAAAKAVREEVPSPLAPLFTSQVTDE